MRYLLLMALGTACLPAEPMTEVRLQGEVRSPQQGAIELWLMHTTAGGGCPGPRWRSSRRGR